MAEYGELSPCDIGLCCSIEPINGENQKMKTGVIMDDTKTLYKVRVDGERDYLTFFKKTMQIREDSKAHPPRYKLSVTN